MVRKTLRAPLALSDENRKFLTNLSGSMTAPVREVVQFEPSYYFDTPMVTGLAVSTAILESVLLEATKRSSPE